MAGAVVIGVIGLLVLVPLALISICIAIVVISSGKVKRDA